jgi:hypothetical protein
VAVEKGTKPVFGKFQRLRRTNISIPYETNLVVEIASLAAPCAAVSHQISGSILCPPDVLTEQKRRSALHVRAMQRANRICLKLALRRMQHAEGIAALGPDQNKRVLSLGNFA